MRKSFMTIGSAAMAILTFATSVPQVQAASPRPDLPFVVDGNVTAVRDHIWRGGRYHRSWNGRNDPGSWDGRGYYRPRDGLRYYDRRRDGYRNGRYFYYRGYDTWRPGYRRHSGFWFPAAAFATGLIIGGAVANRPAYDVPRAGSRDHVRYCMARYRSYRVSDDSYQPNTGPRRRCR